jgi:hypothetical protein
MTLGGDQQVGGVCFGKKSQLVFFFCQTAQRAGKHLAPHKQKHMFQMITSLGMNGFGKNNFYSCLI